MHGPETGIIPLRDEIALWTKIVQYVWLNKIHMMDRGLTHTSLDQNLGTKNVESDRLHMGIAFLNLQGFKRQRRHCPDTSRANCFPDQVHDRWDFFSVQRLHGFRQVVTHAQQETKEIKQTKKHREVGSLPAMEITCMMTSCVSLWEWPPNKKQNKENTESHKGAR